MKMKNDHRSKFSNLSNWKKTEACKKKYGLQRVRTLTSANTGAMLYIAQNTWFQISSQKPLNTQQIKETCTVRIYDFTTRFVTIRLVL